MGAASPGHGPCTLGLHTHTHKTCGCSAAAARAGTHPLVELYRCFLGFLIPFLQGAGVYTLSRPARGTELLAPGEARSAGPLAGSARCAHIQPQADDEMLGLASCSLQRHPGPGASTLGPSTSHRPRPPPAPPAAHLTAVAARSNRTQQAARLHTAAGPLASRGPAL